jgi:polyketide biosynthesis 3-hydroxy-3-methylglutaryl-CoA synthase-like enzyme PksG
MIVVGIEALNVFAGSACLDVTRLAEHRGLDMTRFDNLLMKEKSVALPYEDPVSFGVNAAQPIIDALSIEDRERIEMVITCTESAFDFGKSMSTYFHHHLKLGANCRLMELKAACYSGAAGLQTAINFILSRVSPGAKVLVIATDISRFMLAAGGDAGAQEWSFLEPSGGAGAVALLLSDVPHVMRFDVGANGYYGYEVMDTCRPTADGESGNADLSLLSYLDCCENAFLEYKKRVPGADFVKTFGYIAMHTPFGGMVKGAHRNVMRKLMKADAKEIEGDFERRLTPGLTYCQRVGNVMGATTVLSLASTIDNGDFDSPKRIGCFSYGSGCCSEFFSGVVGKAGQERIRALNIKGHLDRRYKLSMHEYDALLQGSSDVKFGTRNALMDTAFLCDARRSRGAKTLYLREIKDYHREYEWVS